MVCPACTDRAACRKAKDCAARPQRVVVVAGSRAGSMAFAVDCGVLLRPRHEQLFDVVQESSPYRQTEVDRTRASGRRWLENAMREAAAGIPRMFGDAVIAAVHARHMALVQAAIPSGPATGTRRSRR